MIGDVELRSLGPDYFGEEGSRTAAAGCREAVGCGFFWGAGFWGYMSLTPALAWHVEMEARSQGPYWKQR